MTTLANTLGPTLQALRPAARALGPVAGATRPPCSETTPIIRDQIRPFTAPPCRSSRRCARPPATWLRSRPTSTTFKVLNYALNELAYNPPGSEEGFLFWISWANHLGVVVFSTQDAARPDPPRPVHDVLPSTAPARCDPERDPRLLRTRPSGGRCPGEALALELRPTPERTRCARRPDRARPRAPTRR